MRKKIIKQSKITGKRKGLALIITLVVITVISIVFATSAIFIGQRILEMHVRLDRLRAVLTAQAGLHWTIYQYRVNGVTNYTGDNDPDFGIEIVTDETFFTAGGQEGSGAGSEAGNLLIDTPNAIDRYLTFRIPVENIGSSDITIASVCLKAEGTQNQIITRVRMDGNTVYRWRWFSGDDPIYLAECDGDTCHCGEGTCGFVDIDDYIISSGERVIIQFRFFWAMKNLEEINMTFTMGDGSSACATWYATLLEDKQNIKLFTMRSTGEITQGVTIYRTIEADIDVTKSDTTYISAFEEIDEKLP